MVAMTTPNQPQSVYSKKYIPYSYENPFYIKENGEKDVQT